MGLNVESQNHQMLDSEQLKLAEDAANSFKPLSKKTIIVRRFFRNKGATIGVILLSCMVLAALCVKFFSPYAIDEMDMMNISTGPSKEHWLGTNQSGADFLTLLGHGACISLVIGFCVGIVTPLLAVVYGCTMAYFGGWVEKIMLFLLETLIMAPKLILVAILMSGRGGGDWKMLVLFLVLLGWMSQARLVRGMTLAFVNLEYVKAARYMGVPSFTIIWRHLVPNIASLIVLAMSQGIWAAILSEVSYSFIGVGVKLPNTSLGLLINQSSDCLDSAPWMFWGPVVVLAFITGPMALINDGLRDAFDPNSSSVGGA